MQQQEERQAVRHRGRMVRFDRQMSDGSTCANGVSLMSEPASLRGGPTFVPLAYVYEEGDLLYLHTGPHQGHFLANVREHPRICIQLNETGCGSAVGRRSSIRRWSIEA